MCQLIAKRAGKILSREVLQACWDKNPDGAGFAYSDGKNVKLLKGYMTFESFWQAYEPHGEKMAMLHFRVATHGRKCPDNTHPFQVADDLVVGHNGVLRQFIPDKKDERSDTHIFAEDFATPFVKALVDWPALKGKRDYLAFIPVLAWSLERFIDYNKLVWMTPNSFYFTGEGRGDWEDDIWFSSGIATRRYYYKKTETVVTPWQGLNGWRGNMEQFVHRSPAGPEDETDFKGGYWCHVLQDNQKIRLWISDKAETRWDPVSKTNMSKEEWLKVPGNYSKLDAFKMAHYLQEDEDGTLHTSTRKFTEPPIDIKPEVKQLPAHLNEDDLIDAAIRAGKITGGKDLTVKDMHMVYMMEKHDEFDAGEITAAEWLSHLADLKDNEFESFCRVFAEGNPDELEILKAERAHGLSIKREQKDWQKTVTLPPWLQKGLASADKVRPRVFLVAGRLVSRSEAGKLLKTSTPLPKTPGFWKPIYNKVSDQITGFVSCDNDAAVKKALEAFGPKVKSQSTTPTAIL